MQSGCADINKRLYIYLIISWTFDQPRKAADATRYGHCSVPPSPPSRRLCRHNGGTQQEERTQGSVFAALRIPFIICMCEKLQNCCYFFFSPTPLPPTPVHLPSHNYEYGKKCQDVFGEGAVDFREDADYFPEVHRVMIVFVRCVLSTCQGRDRRWGVPLPALRVRRAIHIDATSTIIAARVSHWLLHWLLATLESLQLGLIKDLQRRLDKSCRLFGCLALSWLVVKDAPQGSGCALKAMPRTFQTETWARRPCFLHKQVALIESLRHFQWLAIPDLGCVAAHSSPA